MLTVYKDMRTASISLNISWFNNYNIPIICNKIVLCIFEIYFVRRNHTAFVFKRNTFYFIPIIKNRYLSSFGRIKKTGPWNRT